MQKPTNKWQKSFPRISWNKISVFYFYEHSEYQEYCEKGTSLKKIKDTFTVLQGEIPEIWLKNIVLLKKQYKIYLLSNISEIIWSNCEKRFADLGYQVDDRVDNCEAAQKLGIQASWVKANEVEQNAVCILLIQNA